MPVPGFEGYEVSDLGRVRSLDREIRGRFYPGQVLSQTLDPKGYPVVTIGSRGSSRTPARVHVLVMLAFVGPCPPGLEVLHADDVKANNVLGNLRYGTRTSNQHDAVLNGRHGMARKERDLRGHLLVAPNLRSGKLPARICLSCARAHSRGLRAVAAGRPFDFQVVSDEIYVSLGFSCSA